MRVAAIPSRISLAKPRTHQVVSKPTELLLFSFGRRCDKVLPKPGGSTDNFRESRRHHSRPELVADVSAGRELAIVGGTIGVR